MLYTYYVLLVIAFILSVFPQNRKDKALSVFCFLIGFAMIAQALQEVFVSRHLRNYYVFHLFNYIEFNLYGLYFYFLFESRVERNIVKLSMFLYSAFFIFYFTLIKSILEQSFGFLTVVEGILMVLFSVYFYIHLLRSNKYYNLLVYPHFYINNANLIFFSLSIFGLGFDAYFRSTDPAMAHNVRYINKYSNILMYLLYCIAFACNIWNLRLQSRLSR
jgi:hypothetical protein